MCDDDNNKVEMKVSNMLLIVALAVVCMSPTALA